MYLKRLSLINFKNIGQEEFPLTPGINCFVGDNGAGKTNFIDAIHYLSMCKSAFSMTDTQSVRHGEEFFLLEGSYERSDGRGEQIVCSFARRGGKTLKRNGKEYDRLSDHVGLVPVVIVSPADTALVSDAADERRRYLNGCISQLDRGYLSAVMRYNAVLSERNRYLKVGSDEDMLSIYDRQLAEHGQAIYEKRKAFAERLQPLVGEYYALLSGRREQVELTYRSELAEAPFTELLQRARQRDLANQFTTAGIHRDDLVLRIDGYPLRKYGSQGQQKSFLVALKLAQYRIVGADKGEKPILLLDDLFDKLDMGRVEQLIKLVSGRSSGRSLLPTATRFGWRPFSGGRAATIASTWWRTGRLRNKTCGRAAPCSGRVQDAAREVDGMNLRYFERRTEVVRAYVRAENGCEETNHFVKPSAVELARIAEARNGRKKFDVFVKPNGQSRACASYAMARKRLLRTNG